MRILRVTLVLFNQQVAPAPSIAAATPVVPEPANGSRTRPPLGATSRTRWRISSSGLTAMWSFPMGADQGLGVAVALARLRDEEEHRLPAPVHLLKCEVLFRLVDPEALGPSRRAVASSSALAASHDLVGQSPSNTGSERMTFAGHRPSSSAIHPPEPFPPDRVWPGRSPSSRSDYRPQACRRWRVRREFHDVQAAGTPAQNILGHPPRELSRAPPHLVGWLSGPSRALTTARPRHWPPS